MSLIMWCRNYPTSKMCKGENTPGANDTRDEKLAKNMCLQYNTMLQSTPHASAPRPTDAERAANRAITPWNYRDACLVPIA